MKLFFLYLWLIVAVSVAAQDTLWMSEVVKSEKGSGHQAIQNPFTAMRYQQGKKVSDVLGEFSSVYVKNYGNGQLASLAVRGTAATQSEIQWNGIRLNSPVLGQADLSLFAVGLQDELRLVKTGYEGNIGATLQLQDDTQIDSGIMAAVTLRAGSFKTLESGITLKYGKRKISGATRFSYLRSDNDFTFRNTFKEGHPIEKQTHAQVRLLAFKQQWNAELTAHHSLHVYFWLNEAKREIPPIISKPEGHERQDDYSLRLMATWQADYRSWHSRFVSAYLQDNIRYQNPDAQLDETTVSTAVRHQFRWTYTFPFNLALNGAVSYDYEQARVAEYHRLAQRHTVGLKGYANYYPLSGLKIHTGFREDLVNGQFSAFAPELSVGYTAAIKQAHRLTGGLFVSRNFRFPTLNDWYWTPGGNPDLKQEKSWNGEFHLEYAFRQCFSLRLTNFYLYVDDWIQWIPTGSMWSAVNFRRVFSRGAEVTLHASTTNHPSPDMLVAAFFVSYTYTKATNLDAASVFDQSAGRQLIYVPEHCVTGGVELAYKRFYLRSVNSLCSRRYTATDNSQFLKAYAIANLEAGKDFVLVRHEIGLSFRVKNLIGTAYEQVAQRPMPGRSFEGVIRWNLL